MEKSSSPLMSSGEEGESLSVIQSGKDLRKEDETPFWDDFITLCSNSKGLADLLNVGQDKVRSWPSRIKEAMDKLSQQNAQGPQKDDETELMPTGVNGAVTVNQDPYLGEM